MTASPEMPRAAVRGVNVFQPDDGESYWRPKPANGYVVVKISPMHGGTGKVAMGIQVVPPGGFVPEHSHSEQEEILFCYEGEGVVEVEGAAQPFVPGTAIYATPWLKHRIVNTGTRALKFTWTMLPAGLENFFSAIGRPRQPGDPAPAPFDPPADVAGVQRKTGFGDLQR